MITLLPRTDLISSLSLYCFGRILARRFGYTMAPNSMRRFVKDSHQPNGTTCIGSVLEWTGQWPFESMSGRRLAKEDLSTAPGRALRLAGSFNRFDLLADDRNQIRNDWLVPQKQYNRRSSDDFAICLSYPTFDHPDSGCLNTEEIRRLVRIVPHSRLYFVVGEQEHSLLAELMDLGGAIVHLEGWDKLMFIREFQKIAISQDMIQWWGAFLSEAREIYFPNTDAGPWSHPEPAYQSHEPEWHGIDMRVSDEPRWIYDW